MSTASRSNPTAPPCPCNRRNFVGYWYGYTIDDLRLPPKRSLRKGRSVEQFSTLEEALARYQSLPAAGIRVLGLTDGIHVLELVKCLPLFPDDQEGEDVLASDYSCFPLWAQEPEAASATGACITAMGLRYRIKGNVS